MPVLYREAFGEIDFDLTDYQFDNSGPDQFDSAGTRYSLQEYANSGWTEVTLEGTLELPSGTKDLFPPDERSDPPGKLLVAIDCLDTHYRTGKTVTTTDVDAGSYDFEETIEREYAYGAVVLRPLLVRTTDCDESGFAQYPYMRIADGNEITVTFDEVETEGSSLMDVHFESFEKTDVVPDHNLYHLDRSDVSSPNVWVNEDYELLTRVLDSEAHHGWAANLRDPLAQWIAKDVVVELVLWAILSSDNEDFDAVWQEPLLEEYGPLIYEDVTDADDPTALYERLIEGGDEAHYLVNTVEKVVQDQVRVTHPLEEFIQDEATDHFLRGS